MIQSPMTDQSVMGGFSCSIEHMFVVTTISVLTLLLIATLCDLRTREVPDWVSITISATGLLAACVGWLGVHPLWMFLGGGAGLAVGWALFSFAKLGGADAKLIAAIGCVVGPVGLLVVLLGMGIAGGVLSLVAIARGQRDYAYVPAITIGFMSYLCFVSQI